MYSNDRREEAAFREAGVAGLYRNGPGDQVGVVLSNAAANKVDVFLHERLVYDVTLAQGGGAQARESVTLFNDAPSERPPSYALGPSGAARNAGLHLVPGEGRWWAAFYCPDACDVAAARSGAASFPLEQGHEHGLSVFSNFLDARPQRPVAVSIHLDLPHVWRGDEASGSYRLVIRSQPMANPPDVTVVLHVPAGMGISWTSRPMRVDGGRATWRGTAGRREVFEVRFQRSFLGRIGGRIWQFLRHPIVRISRSG